MAVKDGTMRNKTSERDIANEERQAEAARGGIAARPRPDATRRVPKHGLY
jgi:hypothetical protein